MESVFSYIIESLLCGALFYALYCFIVSGKSSYNFQRIYLLFSSLFTMLFPLITIPTKTNGIFVITLPQITVVGKGSVAQTTGSDIFTFDGNILKILYFSVLAFSVVMFLFQMIKILYIYNAGEKSRVGSSTIIISELISSPFSFFRRIFICKETKEQEAQYIISHEKAHADRMHSLDILFVSIIKCIQWFNPFIYLLKKELVSIHEYQADKDVLKCGYSVSYYRNLMLCCQFGLTPFVANRLNNSLTIKRLKKMENLIENKNRILMIVSVILVTSALFFMVSCKNVGDKGVAEQPKSVATTVDTAVKPAPAAKTVEQMKAETPVSKEIAKKEVKKAAPAKVEKKKEMISVMDIITEPSKKNSGKEPYLLVEQMPQFPGGEKALMGFISQNIKYPPKLMEDGVQGKVVVRFVVSKTGDIENIEVLKSVAPACSEEAVRVIKMMPKWIPGKQNGENVPVYYVLPVIFKLE